MKHSAFDQVRRSSQEANTRSRSEHVSLRFLKQHYNEPIFIRDLVKVSKRSKRALHKAFRKHFDKTPGHELRRLRIENAKRLLAGSDQMVRTVATLSGYRSLNSFCVAFKNHTGESPGQYRSRFGR